MNRALLSGVSLLVLICGCASHPALSTHDTGRPAPSADPGTYSELRKFDIEVTDARVALNEFSEQADQQVLFDYSALRGRQTHTVVGTLQPAEALKAMLQDTGMVVGYVNERTVAITLGRSNP